LQKRARKTNFDLQNGLIHTGVHISSSTVRLRLLRAGRKAKKKSASYSDTDEEKITMGNKH